MQGTGLEMEPRDMEEGTGARRTRGLSDARAAMLLLRAGSIVWRGFDVPSLRRWNQAQVQDSQTSGDIQTSWAQAERRMAVRPVSDPAFRHYGEQHHFHAMVQKSDKVSRSELVHFPQRGTAEGSEYYYRWSTWFPEKDDSGQPAFPIGEATAGVWQVITQWHQAGHSGVPPVQFSAKRDRDRNPYIGLELEKLPPHKGELHTVWRAPLTYNVWHNFILFMRYSNKANRGEVRLWYSKGPGLPQLQVLTTGRVITTATQGGQGPYLKHGLYRSARFYGQRVSHIVHCGMVEGDSLAAVLP